jgi:hemoglobin
VTPGRASEQGIHEVASGRTMEDSHRHLAMTAREWQAFLDDVQATLDKFSVPAGEQAEIFG